ncbi:MAG: TolC family protein [Phycisphaerales bacterium]|jgi:outer membrane protein TolC
MRQKRRYKLRSELGLWKPDVCRWIVAAFVCLILTGCGAPVVEEDPRIKALTARLSEIETVRFEEQSSSEPITIEEATVEVVEQITEPNESQSTVELTLAEARAAALANNLDLKLELVDLSIGQLALDEEWAKFESLFFGSVQHSSSEAVGTGTESRTTSYNAGIQSPLHTGGSLAVSVPFSDAESDSADFEGVSEAAVSVSFIQSLLRNAGTRINTQSIRIASHQKHISDAWTKYSAINILAQVDTTYWYLLAAHRELEVRREQYKLALGQLNHARNKVEAGAAAGIEIVGAEAGLGWRLEDVINAETALRNTERDLKRIMNRDDMPVESDIAIVTVTEPDPLGLDLDEQIMVEAAIANRTDMISMELGLAIDELNIESARNATLPDVTFDYTFGTRTESGTIGRAFGNLANSSFPSHSIGLSASIPLGNQAAKAQLHRAQLQRMQGLITREQLQQRIRQEVREAVNDLRQNWRRILAAAQNLTAAYNDYEVEQSQFQIGRSTSTEVLRRAGALGDAQLRKIRAFVGYEIAKVNLARTTGTLLGYGRIQLEPIDIRAE